MRTLVDDDACGVERRVSISICPPAGAPYGFESDDCELYLYAGEPLFDGRDAGGRISVEGYLADDVSYGCESYAGEKFDWLFDGRDADERISV